MFKKNIVIVAFILTALSPALGLAAEESLTKKGVKEFMSGVVSTGKDIVSGAEAGVEQGRKTGESTDGAVLVSTREELAELLNVSVLKLENVGDGIFKVTLAIRNENEFPVRITELNEMKAVVLLDSDGFAYTLTSPELQGMDVTVLGRAATKTSYTFIKVEGTPAIFRLLGQDYPISASK